MIDNLREQQGDLTDCEVKRGLGGVPTVGPTLSAFGNMPSGGTIIVGLDESQRFAATGVDDLAAMRHGIAAQARAAVAPPVTVTFDDYLVDGERVLVCDVSGLPIQHRPCRYQKRAYLRQADGDYMMSEADLDLIEDRKRRAAADHTMWSTDDARPVPGSGLDDLDDQLVDDLLRTSRARNARHRGTPDDLVLRDLGVTTSTGELTVAGAYVIGRYPQRFVPSWSVTAAVQLPPGSESRTRDLTHIEGPLPAMLAELNEWVARNIHTTIVYRPDGNAFNEAELPAVAVRELTANALVHRDLGPYTRGKAISVRLTGDKLIIWSPGGLRGITTAQLGQPGGRNAVNPSVYRLCERLSLPSGDRVIEAEGGGIREARRRTADAGLRPITFSDTGVSFTAIVSRNHLLSQADMAWLATNARDHDLTQTQRVILASMSHGQEWTNKMVRDEFDRIDSRDAQVLLQDLAARNLAETVGERGGTHYRISPTLPPAADGVITIVTPSDQQVLDFSVEASATDHEPVRATSPRPAATNYDAVLAEIRATGPSTVEALAGSTGLSERQVRYALHRLAHDGSVSNNGGRPKLWSLVEPR